MASRGVRTARRVLVAVDASPFGLAGLETAACLAAAWRAELLPARVVALRDSGPAVQLSQWARQHPTRLLLVGRPSPVFGDADIQLLAEELDCPVVLLPNG